jgi:trans-aconitate methyltransferase
MQQIAHQWNAELYNTKHAFVFNHGRSLIDVLDPKRDESILDLGCGSGALTAEIGKLASNVIGIDKSSEMIASARLNFPMITFQVGDASNFKFKEKFDAIFSNATLHWVVAYKEAIANMRSNLNKGGRIVVEFGGKDNIKVILDALRATLEERGFKKQAQTNLWYFPSVGEYASALENQGFKVTFAQWYDRPTELADAESGIIDWLRMFGRPFLQDIREEEIKLIEQKVQDKVRPILFKKGKWYADYKRIRVIAIKD